MRPRGMVLLVVLWIALATGAAAAVAAADKPAFPAPPPAGRFTNDAAGLIKKEHAPEIDRLAGALLAQRGYPVRIVTIRSLEAQDAEDYTIEEYAAELIQSWRDDQRFQQYGMLLLVAADDRKARIQLGSAWGDAHDDRARRVMDRMIVPAFKRGDFSAGILEGVRGFDAMGRQLTLAELDPPWWVPSIPGVNLDGLEVSLPGGMSLDGQWFMLPALAAGVLVLLVGLVSVARRGRKSWAWAAAAFVLTIFVSRAVSAARGGGGSEGGATGEW